ncbi:MAG TPA: phosphatidylglycerol lysyltransferase domain-containing protein [bacterium]|nr:phosphatidylglycerol lysyltransferase domain-containing protein [bacterium]
MSNIQWREITLSDRDRMNYYFSKSNFMASEYSFPALFIWRQKYDYRISEFGGHLIIMVRDKNDRYYFYPPGDGDLKGTILTICRDAQEAGGRCHITAITKENVNILETLFPGRFSFITNMDYSDYIYDANNLINLPGRRYHSKRNHISRFIEEYGKISYEDITSSNIAECREAYRQWLEHKKDKGEDMKLFSDEYLVMEECFKHYQAIGLIGGLIRARGNLCSFTFGSRINTETLGIHIEKSLVDCQGGYATINREFAARHAVEYRYINREEDLGLKGLRRAKLSYYPLFLLEKYTAVFKGDIL